MRYRDAMRFEERDGRIYAGDDHAVAKWTARATHPDTGRLIEWDGIDLIQVRDGRICRNAVYSSSHAARVLDQPDWGRSSLGRHDHSSWSSRRPSLTKSERSTPSFT